MTKRANHAGLVAAGLAVFGITLALFIQTSHYDFVNIDDIVYVRGNPHMTGAITFENIGWALTTMRYAACWMPLTWLSYMADVALFGVNPGAIHVVNAVYHACNATLLFLLLWTVFGRRIERCGRDPRTARGGGVSGR